MPLKLSGRGDDRPGLLKKEQGMTHFEKLASSKTEMAYWMMCPYGVEEEICAEKNCIDCCVNWLDKEEEKTDGKSTEGKR